MPITSIPQGQPLLLEDVGSSIPDRQLWTYQENPNDCRDEKEIYIPTYVSGVDEISLQFVADITGGCDYKVELIGTSFAYTKVFAPSLINTVDDDNSQFAWYFLAPDDLDESGCFLLRITYNDALIAFSQHFEIINGARECSVHIRWSNPTDIFDFTYVNEPVPPVVVPDFNNTDWQAQGVTPHRYDLTTTPGKALLPFDAATFSGHIVTIPDFEGLVDCKPYRLTVGFNFNGPVSHEFFVGLQSPYVGPPDPSKRVGVIGTTDIGYNNPNPFTVTYDFIFSGSEDPSILINSVPRAAGTGAFTPFILSIESVTIEPITVGDIKQSMRVPALQWKPKYNEESEKFKDSQGNRFILSATSEAVYELIVGAVPEYIHNALRLAKLHDYFEIDNEQYEVISKEYTPEWNINSNMAEVRLEVVRVEGGDSIRSNC